MLWSFIPKKNSQLLSLFMEKIALIPFQIDNFLWFSLLACKFNRLSYVNLFLHNWTPLPQRFQLLQMSRRLLSLQDKEKSYKVPCPFLISLSVRELKFSPDIFHFSTGLYCMNSRLTQFRSQNKSKIFLNKQSRCSRTKKLMTRRMTQVRIRRNSKSRKHGIIKIKFVAKKAHKYLAVALCNLENCIFKSQTHRKKVIETVKTVYFLNRLI